MTTRGARVHGLRGAKKISTRSAGLRGPGARGAAWAGRAAAVTLVGLVAACGGHVAYAGGDDLPGASKGRVWYGGSRGYGEVVEVPVRLNDGRTVTCLTVLSGHGKGIDCDWQGAR